TVTTIARPGYLSASHLTLTDSTLRSHPAHQTRHPKMPRAFGTVSLMCFGTVGCVSVPEYQLVIHRLRLSASPYVPSYPCRISLALEPLVIRWTGFSPVFRYSCLHSHSRRLHHSCTRRLHQRLDAPLPNTTPLRRPWCCHNFGGVLSPATLSALNHLTSELLRTLSRMAASKPTSWLSSQLNILSH